MNSALEELKAGNQRFLNGKMLHLNQDIARVKELIPAQKPKAVVITCSDSRVTPEILFDQGLGDLFTIRNAGNVISEVDEGSVEYAVEHLGTPLVVVLGHERCGAIAAMLQHYDNKMNGIEDSKKEAVSHITAIIKALEDEEEAQEILNEQTNRASRMTHANVLHAVKHLRESNPILSELYSNKKVEIIGAVYDLETGVIEFLDF